jgi:hypothetical protein
MSRISWWIKRRDREQRRAGDGSFEDSTSIVIACIPPPMLNTGCIARFFEWDPSDFAKSTTAHRGQPLPSPTC